MGEDGARVFTSGLFSGFLDFPLSTAVRRINAGGRVFNVSSCSDIECRCARLMVFEISFLFLRHVFRFLDSVIEIKTRRILEYLSGRVYIIPVTCNRYGVIV